MISANKPIDEQPTHPGSLAKERKRLVRRRRLTKLLGCILAAAIPLVSPDPAAARGIRGGGGHNRGASRGGVRGPRGGVGPGRADARAGNQLVLQYLQQCQQQFSLCQIQARQGIAPLMGPPTPGVGP